MKKIFCLAAVLFALQILVMIYLSDEVNSPSGKSERISLSSNQFVIKTPSPKPSPAPEPKAASTPKASPTPAPKKLILESAFNKAALKPRKQPVKTPAPKPPPLKQASKKAPSNDAQKALIDEKSKQKEPLSAQAAEHNNALAAQINALLNANKRFPRRAAREHLHGSVVGYFIADANGVKITIKRSDHALFAAAAKQTIERIRSKLPAAALGKNIGFELEFR